MSGYGVNGWAYTFITEAVRRNCEGTMGIKQMFADTRTAQEGDNVIQLTVPKAVVDELGIEGGDEVLWTGEEGDNTAVIHAPDHN